jgi:hypothetical protein
LLVPIIKPWLRTQTLCATEILRINRITKSSTERWLGPSMGMESTLSLQESYCVVRQRHMEVGWKEKTQQSSTKVRLRRLERKRGGLTESKTA